MNNLLLAGCLFFLCLTVLWLDKKQKAIEEQREKESDLKKEKEKPNDLD